MRPLLRVLLCFSCLFLPGCGGGTGSIDPPPTRSAAVDQEFTLKVGQQARVQGEDLSLVLRAVPEDSRCPEDVTCVWAGNARLQAALRKTARVGTVIELNTNTISGPREAAYLNYVVRLVSLAPNPRSNQAIAARDYVATLVVSKQ